MAQEFEEVAKGKVATLISDSELAFNVGSTSGVQPNDMVTLFERIEIKDPDSGSVLGSVRIPRINLKVNILGEAFGTGLVVDREPMNSITDAARIRPLKKIMQRIHSNQEAPFNTVLVGIGDEVVIRRRKPEDPSEPPF